MTHLDPGRPNPDSSSTEQPMGFQEMARTSEFAKLRSTFRGFAFPMTIAGLASYFVYVVLSVFLPEFMGRPLFGSFSIGMTLGLFQFAVTWIWTALYVRFANKRLALAARRQHHDFVVLVAIQIADVDEHVLRDF